MKIAVIGSGAIGSVVAALLSKAGEDVVIVGRDQAQVDKINADGIRVLGVGGDQTIPVKALLKLDKEYDLVIFTTKSQDIEDAYQQNYEFLENCYVLSSQNGVQADSMLGPHFEKEKMLSSIVMFGATYTNPGEVTYNFPGDWIIGRPYTSQDDKLKEVADTLGKAFNVVLSENIIGMKYLKLFVNFNNCIPALINKSMQETYADIDMCQLSVLLLREGVDIVKKAKIEMVSMPNFPVDRINGLINLPVEDAAEIMRQTLTKLSEEPLYGSILQSIQRGKPSEIDFINGEVVHLAKQMRQEAPLNEKIVEMVHLVEQNKKFYSIDNVKESFNIEELVMETTK